MKNDENKENSATSENKMGEKSAHKELLENKLLQRVKKHGDKKTSEMSQEELRETKSLVSFRNKEGGASMCSLKGC